MYKTRPNQLNSKKLQSTILCTTTHNINGLITKNREEKKICHNM